MNIPLQLDNREFSEAPRPGVNNPFEMELRGYELARKAGDSWVQVSHYRPTHFGWETAVKAGRALQERHPDETYTVRPIVSMAAPKPAAPQVNA